MKVVSRAVLLECLENEWGKIVERYAALSEANQLAYLRQQGYARFADLLAHVIAWWEEAQRAVPVMVCDPAFTSPDYDVDRFNALAVEHYQNLSEAQVIKLFEARRQEMIALVNGLSEADLARPDINRRLKMEFPGHYSEHTLA